LKQENPQTNIILLLGASILLQSFSFLSIKISTLQEGMVFLVFLMAAFGFMVVRAIVWQSLLRLTDISKVYPYVALVQILILGYAVLLFNEQVTLNNLLGLLLMFTGILFISRD
jgi:drug/metabolite transporter (DMT)-like permease